MFYRARRTRLAQPVTQAPGGGRTSEMPGIRRPYQEKEIPSRRFASAVRSAQYVSDDDARELWLRQGVLGRECGDASDVLYFQAGSKGYEHTSAVVKI